MNNSLSPKEQRCWNRSILISIGLLAAGVLVLEGMKYAWGPYSVRDQWWFTAVGLVLLGAGLYRNRIMYDKYGKWGYFNFVPMASDKKYAVLLLVYIVFLVWAVKLIFVDVRFAVEGRL